MAYTTSCTCTTCGGNYCQVSNGPVSSFGTCNACWQGKRLQEQYGDDNDALVRFIEGAQALNLLERWREAFKNKEDRYAGLSQEERIIQALKDSGFVGGERR